MLYEKFYLSLYHCNIILILQSFFFFQSNYPYRQWERMSDKLELNISILCKCIVNLRVLCMTWKGQVFLVQNIGI